MLSSALDYATSAALDTALRSLEFKPTVITVSQRVSAIRGADMIIVLDEGHIAGTGTDKRAQRKLRRYTGKYVRPSLTWRKSNEKQIGFNAGLG